MQQKTMKAAVYKENGVIALEERPVPELNDPRDAIIRVTLSSICSSDLHIKHGKTAKVKNFFMVQNIYQIILQVKEIS